MRIVDIMATRKNGSFHQILKDIQYYTEKITKLEGKNWREYTRGDHNEKELLLTCLGVHVGRLADMVRDKETQEKTDFKHILQWQYRDQIHMHIQTLENGMFCGTWLDETTDEKIADMCKRFGYCTPEEAAKYLHKGIEPDRTPKYPCMFKMAQTTQTTQTTATL